MKDITIEYSNNEPNKIRPLFKGRISRNEFILSDSLFFVISIIGVIYSYPGDIGFLYIVNIIVALATASLIVQRLHDLGRPGYHYWLLAIPIYNIIFILGVLCSQHGQAGSNKYGADPLKNKKKILK